MARQYYIKTLTQTAVRRVPDYPCFDNISKLRSPFCNLYISETNGTISINHMNCQLWWRRVKCSLMKGPYCRWTRVRNAIAWRKTQNEKFPKYVSLGPPTTRKMYILRPFWVDQVHRRHAKSYFLRRRRTCRRTQYIRINLGRKTGFASTQKAFGSTQKVFGQRKRFLVNAKAFWVNANRFEPVLEQNIYF